MVKQLSMGEETIECLHRFLDHKKTSPSRTLQKAHAYDPMVFLKRGADSHERGTPVRSLQAIVKQLTMEAKTVECVGCGVYRGGVMGGAATGAEVQEEGDHLRGARGREGCS